MAPLEFVRRVGRGFRKNQGFLLASAVAYNALLSIVPLFAILLLALSKLVDRARLLGMVSTSVEQLLPGRSAAITDQVTSFLEHGEMVGLLGGVSLLFFSSVAFTVVENAMSVIFHHRDARKRHFLVSAVIPYLFIMALGVAILVGTLLASAFSILGRDLHLGGEPIAGMSRLLLWMAGTGGLAILLTALYMVLPKGHVAFRHAAVGGITATLLWELVRRGLGWYFTTLSMVNVVYGALGNSVVVLLSFEVVAIILLVGAQVIAELERGADPPPAI